MTTKNRAIACYLPDNIERRLVKYCHDEKILQSDGKTPKMGTAVIKILESYFGIIPSDTASKIPKESLEDIVKGIVLDVLPSNVSTVDEVVSPAQLNRRATSIISEFNHTIAHLLKRIEVLEGKKIEKTPTQPNETPLLDLIPSKDAPEGASETEDIQSHQNTPIGLTNKELVERLKQQGIVISIRTVQEWATKYQKGNQFIPDKYPNLWHEWKVKRDSRRIYHWFPIEP